MPISRGSVHAHALSVPGKAAIISRIFLRPRLGMADIRIEEHSSPIKTPKQLAITVVLAFLVPVVVIVMVANLVTGGIKAPKEAMTPEAVAQRLKPVGTLVVAGTPAAEAEAKLAAAAPAPTPAADAPAQAAADDGQTVYQKTCAACHATGVAGAPKFGDKAAWAPRIAQGKEGLYVSALKGKGAMPPKGGNVSLPDAAVKAAVDYLVDHAR
ncbi:cytochrome c5 family protein [Pelomicrobium methylotrophicum]|uniref:Cytochrome c5 family protein n=2 Tax=Pelomicrobium methylotrophicum TaxID=2602750 RepID=A0A5C7EMT7_9PROT|nr:cytochrome c5 family protein [Pelomicrobium methylotrophicum]